MRLVKSKADVLKVNQDMLKRPVNVGFSGGEKKRAEILQMAVLEPKLCILDETDSGLDIDALRVVAEGVNALRSPDRAMVVITHYQRLLNYLVPDVTHVLLNGRLVKSGGPELAHELEERGRALEEAQGRLGELDALRGEKDSLAHELEERSRALEEAQGRLAELDGLRGERDAFAQQLEDRGRRQGDDLMILDEEALGRGRPRQDAERDGMQRAVGEHHEALGVEQGLDLAQEPPAQLAAVELGLLSQALVLARQPLVQTPGERFESLARRQVEALEALAAHPPQKAA